MFSPFETAISYRTRDRIFLLKFGLFYRLGSFLFPLNEGS
ncbi:hypothetical protein LEP1GSC123_3440 [Leptospira borgpetersenii str. 200701203]|uniref:Uncharacterized protein n=1 Tax=Leptospira borgpetersenii str. 200701203 TaxID=1193007 RepID=M3GDH8_LEPBO|nr:hypothetical protein LEP1GSC123_3440 [Leptospira borgpetersenii str. 200701203]